MRGLTIIIFKENCSQTIPISVSGSASRIQSVDTWVPGCCALPRVGVSVLCFVGLLNIQSYSTSVHTVSATIPESVGEKSIATREALMPVESGR